MTADRPRPVVFVLSSVQAMAPSGVTTFVRQLIASSKGAGALFGIVELPTTEVVDPGEPVLGSTMDGPADTAATTDDGEREAPVVMVEPGGILRETQGERILPLVLGYVKECLRDIRRVWAVRDKCRGKTLVTNLFGCELFPVALRMVNPWSRIIAIAHTHPGQDARARHYVRRLVERLCYHCVSEVIYNSDSTRREWGYKLGLRQPKGQVVYLGTEPPDDTIPVDYPARQAGVVDFLCVARFANWKGQGNLIRAWKAMLNQGVRNARLILIGEGECLNAVQQEAQQLGVRETVVFLGYRDKADCYFNEADVAVLMSTEPEAFGLVLLEGMSRGKPVIASRLGGITEIVQDGETGLLVDPTDIEAISNALCSLATSEGERRRLGNNGKRVWASKFTLGHMIQRYHAAFGIAACNQVG